MSNRTYSILALATATILISATANYGTAQDAAAPRTFKPRSGCSEDVGIEFHRCALEKLKTFKPPLTADGRPNFSGYWSRVMESATIEERGPDLPEPRDARVKRPSMIVDPPDGVIPYQAWARRQANWNWQTYIDPQSQCYLPGPQRFTIGSPGGYQILQPRGNQEMVMLSERVHLYRHIPLDGRGHIPANIKLSGGDPVGRWDGNTLVIDFTNLDGETWFDDAGNFLSDAAHLVERWTMVDPSVLHVETMVEDPKVFSRPFKMVIAMIRISGQYEVLEDACWEGERDLMTMTKLQRRYPGWKGLPGPYARGQDPNAER